MDFGAFRGETPVILPAWESIPREQSAADPVFSARLRVVRELAMPSQRAGGRETASDGGREPGDENREPPLRRRVSRAKTKSDSVPLSHPPTPSLPTRVVITSFPALLPVPVLIVSVLTVSTCVLLALPL